MRRSRPGAIGDVNKETFLEVYCDIRPLALSQYNIEQAWKKSGLLPLNPDVVLSQIKRLKPQDPEKPEPLTKPLIEDQIQAEIQQVHASKTSNSRPTTAYNALPSLDLTIPEIQITLPLRMTFKTPGNIAELEQLKELFKKSQIDQGLLFDKAIKAAQYGLAKAVITEATNQDLVEAADEARKKGNKVSGKNGKARVIDEKEYMTQLRSESESWWIASIYGNLLSSQRTRRLSITLVLASLELIYLNGRLPRNGRKNLEINLQRLPRIVR